MSAVLLRRHGPGRDAATALPSPPFATFQQPVQQSPGTGTTKAWTSSPGWGPPDRVRQNERDRGLNLLHQTVNKCTVASPAAVWSGLEPVFKVLCFPVSCLTARVVQF